MTDDRAKARASAMSILAGQYTGGMSEQVSRALLAPIEAAQ